MKNTIEYKGYIGNIEFSKKDNIFYGKIQRIKSLILYEGKNVKALIEDFHIAVDDYLQLCAARGTKTETTRKERCDERTQDYE